MLNTLYLHLRMVKLTAAAGVAVATLLSAGCFGEITNGNGTGTLTPEQIAAENDFQANVLPVLDGFCGSCHTAMQGVAFMAGPDVHATIMGWPNLVNLDTPAQSLLVNKGPHEGPALTVDQQATLLQWLTLEQTAAAGTVTTIQTSQFQPVPGINTIDLASIGMAGSTVTFNLQPLSVGIYLNELMLNAGSAGAHVVHPLFVTYDASGNASPDPVDRFSDIDLTVAPSMQSPIGGGTAVFVNVDPTTKLSLHFKVATAADGSTTTGGGGITGGGCKSVAGFTQYAQPLLAQNCTSCHAGQNAGATSATDMTKVNDLSTAGQTAACGQILSRVDVNTPSNSGLFVTTDPAQNVTHPFKFNGNQGAHDAFVAQLTMWINQEK
jgi:hypothetical protein